MTETQDPRPAILITGASGGLASIVVDFLSAKYRLVGVDPRSLPPDREFPGVFHRVDYRQRKMADVFRQTKFDALIHLGRVPVDAKTSIHSRFNLNVLGTRNLLDLALKYGIKRAIVCSTFHVYGAHQHNHLHITEEDPLRATQIFPEIVDAAEMDHLAQAFLLRNREIKTVILRPVNIVGPRLRNQISNLFRSKFVPVMMGYDPILQFIHERDFARALTMALEGDRSGIYNVAGEGVVPYTNAIEIAGRTPVPVPSALLYPTVGALQRLGVAFPKHLLDYFKYPTIISDDAFRRDFGYEPRVSTVDALRSINMPVPARRIRS
jgi:UDP-glucose 4-epimerase